MPPSLPSRLLTELQPWRDAPAWRLALSGGLDSSVLLHLLAHLARTQRLPPISAIHVHHGLQPVADAWPGHCQRFCEGLGIPLEVIRVRVAPGASLEAAARQARYAAFESVLGEGEVLLTAQHRDDQAETLLFRLLRGAGVKGLAGMPRQRPLGRGYLGRPLLGVSRHDLEAYAESVSLTWVEDPSNTAPNLTRNYLRHFIFPRLDRQWPQARANLARCAGHMAEAQGLLDDLARLDLATASEGSALPWLELPSLDLAAVRALSPARQRNLLRHWLAAFTLLPDTDHWAGWASLRDAAIDATPRWRLASGALLRAEERVWFLPEHWLAAPGKAALDWHDPMQPLCLPNNGEVSLEGEVMSGALQIRYRQGGERLRLPERGRRDLKRLLNEAGVPFFLRERLPLLYRDGVPISVANLPALDTAGCSLVWRPPGLR